MKLVVCKNLGSQIWYRSLDPVKKQRHSNFSNGLFLPDESASVNPS